MASYHYHHSYFCKHRTISNQKTNNDATKQPPTTNRPRPKAQDTRKGPNPRNAGGVNGYAKPKRKCRCRARSHRVVACAGCGTHADGTKCKEWKDGNGDGTEVRGEEESGWPRHPIERARMYARERNECPQEKGTQLRSTHELTNSRAKQTKKNSSKKNPPKNWDKKNSPRRINVRPRLDQQLHDELVPA